MLALEDALRGITNSRLAYPVSSPVTFGGVTQDSRLVKDGDLFVALSGARDGHEFIPDAFRRGALGVLAQHTVDLSGCLPDDRRADFAYFLVPDTLAALQELAAYWLRLLRIPVVAVTGSVGKTTTKEMIAAVLSGRYRVLKSEGNLNNEIGLPLSVLRLRPEHERAVLEMGMYDVGEIASLCRIAPPTIGVVTNVGPSHLARLGSMERIAAAKSELPAALPAGGYAILNGDDPRVLAMSALTPAKVIRYGFGPGNDLRAGSLQSHGLDGVRFSLSHLGARVAGRCPTPGRHVVYACLAAAAVGLAEGLPWDDILAGLAAGAGRARISTVAGPFGSFILDDTYNASPVSVIAALDLLAELPGRHIAVLGDMLELGDYEEQGHREVGRHAAGRVDQLYVVGERARRIGEEALRCGVAGVHFAATKDEVSLVLQAGDFVLVKGSRGMEMEIIVARLRRMDGDIEEVVAE